MALTGGEVAGIDNVDIRQVLCSENSVLMRCGEAGADVHMEHGVIFLCQLGKAVVEHADRHGCRAAQRAARCNMSKNIGGLDIDAVAEALVALVDKQGKSSMSFSRRSSGERSQVLSDVILIFIGFSHSAEFCGITVYYIL